MLQDITLSNPVVGFASLSTCFVHLLILGSNYTFAETAVVDPTCAEVTPSIERLACCSAVRHMFAKARVCTYASKNIQQMAELPSTCVNTHILVKRMEYVRVHQ